MVYKPVAGERPLWDFPDGTLAGREVAAYVVSEALGWDVVPPTVLRDGPHGPGMVQLWHEPDAEQAPVDIVRRGTAARRAGCTSSTASTATTTAGRRWSTRTARALRRMAVFDVVVNNADRKGGHVLAMPDGHRYGVDHGVTFHVDTSCAPCCGAGPAEPLDGRGRRRSPRCATALAATSAGRSAS